MLDTVAHFTKIGSHPARWVVAVFFMAAVALAMPTAGRAAPRDELLGLVPDDIAICLVVNDLRSHARKFTSSEACKCLHKTVIGKLLAASPELQKIRNVDTELKKHLKVSWQQVQDDILGDSVIFAFHQGNGGDRKKDRGLLLLWARNPDLLAQLIQRINQAQLDSGEITKVENHTYRGITYYQRIEANDKRQFYFQKKSLFAFSNQEGLIRQVIDRHTQDSGSKKAFIVRSFSRLPKPDALVTFWGNPRAFDAELEQKAEAAAKESDRHVLKTWSRYWKALDAFAVSADIQPELELFLSLQGRPKELPKRAQKLFFPLGNAKEMWGRFPAKTAIAVAGRVDFQALLQTLEDFMTPTVRQKFRANLQRSVGSVMGRDFMKAVLPHLGPDFGFFVAAAPKKGTISHIVFALRIRPGPKDAPVDKKIIRALNLFAGVAVFAYNSKHTDTLELQMQQRKHVEINYLTSNKFPRGFQPAFSLKDGYLVLASSPAAIDRFQKGQGTTTGKAPLFRLSFGELARVLDQNQDFVVRIFARKKQVPEPTARRVLGQVVASLNLLDQMEINQQNSKGQISWRLRLSVSKSLGH